ANAIPRHHLKLGTRQQRDRICLVGRNGSGKSTLLKIAAGLVEPDDGERFVQPRTSVAYLAQDPDLTAFATVGDYVRSAFSDEASAHPADIYFDALAIDPALPTTTLSGGEARRAALAHTLSPEPDVLLLDEPTNHLDLPAIEWLETTLQRFRGAVVLISHDRAFLEALSRRTIWIDRGVTRAQDKGFAAFEDWRDSVFEAEELAQHKLDRRIAREEDWMQGGVSGRRKRNVRRVAELRDLKEQRRTASARPGQVNMEASESETSGRLVIDAKGLSKAFADAPPVVRDFSIRVARGERVGIVGPNGAGKTTLIRLLTGTLEPDTGSIRHGANLDVLWIDQNRSQLVETQSVTDTLTGGRGETVFVNGRARHVATYLKDFLFLPEQARSPVSALSGGERARLLLAKALAQPSNLMILDEPTNDLDLETLDLLQELLGEYAGTVLLVSHDRDFLDRTCTRLIAGTGDGHWTAYAGGYSDMLAQRQGEALSARAAKPAAGAGSGSGKPGSDRAAAAPAPPSKARSAKLSFKDKHALETLPARIAELEGRIAQLTEQLADPDLFTKAPDTFASATEAMTRAQQDLEAAETQWLELEMKREELEA
ncbi:MAG: ATP-binding cassette domain-containing protein, partial [Pseudomonadota bacterium]